MRLNSIGKMSERIQRAPGAIEDAIDKLGIRPQLTLNGLRYFSLDDETAIRQFLLEKSEEAAWAAKSLNDPQN